MWVALIWKQTVNNNHMARRRKETLFFNNKWC